MLDTTRIDLATNVVKTTAAAGQQIEQWIEKTGDRFQIKQSQRIGGDILVKDGMLVQTNQPAPMMAKCSVP